MYVESYYSVLLATLKSYLIKPACHVYFSSEFISYFRFQGVTIQRKGESDVIEIARILYGGAAHRSGNRLLLKTTLDQNSNRCEFI